jgi:hypothetical protein
MIRSKILKAEREILLGAVFIEFCEQSSFSVIIGVYNAQPYLNSILEQIQTQSINKYPLIIIDNGSTDGTWETLQNWPEDILCKTKLIRNKINFGPLGTIYLNMHEIETEWLISWHQDDMYFDNYLHEFSKELERPTLDQTDVVFFDMGSMSDSGVRVPTLIRQSWIANQNSSSSAFLANLVQQTVSYPSAAFRTTALREISIPWHSSSFPDTEITLLQAAYGKFKFIPKRTMLYRMNPKSESHSLNPRERVLGPFASLSRVMASDSFIRLCSQVDVKNRTDFSQRVLQGIDIRLGESQLGEMVKLIAAESMALAWDYAEPNSREQILRTYKLAEDGRTTKLLGDLGILYRNSEISDQSPSIAPLSKEISQSIERILDSATPPSNIQGSGALKVLLTVIAGILPLNLRRSAVKLLVKMYVALNPKSAWNLSWNPKH